MQRKPPLILPMALALVSASSIGSAHAQNRISIEAVDDYSCNSLNYNIANVDNFRNRMLSISGFSAGIRYTDTSVWATDFRDPEKVSGGGDTFNFDRPGDAISYFSGHGLCDDQTDTECTTASSCPTIAGLGKQCIRHTNSPLRGRCMYSRPRTLTVDQGYGCVDVNYSSGDTRLGESTTSGTFAGAGTNGGVNFAVLDVSCAVTPNFWGLQWGNASAGVSTIAAIMPTRYDSDNNDSANRGQAWADRYVANTNSAVAPAWTESINSVTGGWPCAFGGGEHGIVGCGAHLAVSFDATQAGADWANHTETWNQLQTDANDALGSGFATWIYWCNYDCNTFGWTL